MLTLRTCFVRVLRTMRALKTTAQERSTGSPDAPVSAGAVFETPTVEGAARLWAQSYALRPELLAQVRVVYR